MPRNSSGTYALPAGNPVVTNTLIQSTWANTTLSDVSTAMTDSLDRQGRGAMLAALKNIDGTAVAPAISFSSEGTLGLYRVSAGVLGIAAGGALILSIASTGLTFSTSLALPVGSVTSPSLTFVGNTNTGIYQSATNNMSVSLNGTNAASFDVGRLTYTGGVRSAKSATGYIDLDPTGMTSDYQGALKLLDAGFDFSTNSASRGWTWTNNGTLRLTLSPGGNVTLASGNLILTTGQQIIFNAAGANTLTANNAAGTLALQTGGANNRLTIDAAGVTVISGGTTFSSTVAHVGVVTFNNNVALDWKDSGGTARRNVVVNASNNMTVGDVDNATVGSQTNIAAQNAVNLQVNGSSVFALSSSALTLTSGILISTANSEGMRVRNDSGFISFYNTAGSTRTGILQGNVGAGNMILSAENGNALAFSVGGTVRMRIDTNGNGTLASNLTPSAWGSTNRALEVGALGNAIAGNSTTTSITNGTYFNGTNWVYTTTAAPSLYQQAAGIHSWWNAPAGSVGATFTPTQAMTFDATGNLLIGTTTSLYSAAGRNVLEIAGSSLSLIACRVGSTQGAAMWFDNTNAIFSAETGSMLLKTGGATRVTITSAGVISDATAELGWKDIPANSQSGAYVLVLADRGKQVLITTGGVTVPQSIFAVGNIVTIVNNSGTSQTITQGTGVTMHQGGTTNTGNRTLLPWGIASVLCVGSSVFVISGNIT
jgi:hypothetical protein